MTFRRVESELGKPDKPDQMGDVKILLAVVWRMHGGWENGRVEEGTSEEGRNDGGLHEGDCRGTEGIGLPGAILQYTPISLCVELRERASNKFRCAACVPGRMEGLS